MTNKNRPRTILSSLDFPSPGSSKTGKRIPFGENYRAANPPRLGMQLPNPLSMVGWVAMPLIRPLISWACRWLIIVAIAWWFLSPYLSVFGNPLSELERLIDPDKGVFNVSSISEKIDGLKSFLDRESMIGGQDERSESAQ